MIRRINNNWEFTSHWTEEFLAGAKGEEIVRIPHNVKTLPLHYSDSDTYQMICGYRKVLQIDEGEQGKRQFIRFDAAGHIATVYCNGTELKTHKCGYTMFRVEITDVVKYGEDNTITVRLDTEENPTVPPFGFVIDYLTYGGIYRDVWMESHPRFYVRDVYAATPTIDSLDLELFTDGTAQDESFVFTVCDANENAVFSRIEKPGKAHYTYSHLPVKPWSIDEPNLYTLHVDLQRNGITIDSKEVSVGFRTVRFDDNRFYLNDSEVFIRGLNRHQCIPYAGYAVTEKLQRLDADILKYELGCNAVRTSHYPQSHYFLDECDKIGLLVFTEIPGWQHIGDHDWKRQAVENTAEMVTEYRNHPSIYLWGVRINESQDDDDFYTATNNKARILDPYRATSGVRYLEQSSLKEDVYAFNDFTHNGMNSGVREKKKVTPDINRPLLISESNGHMFPTKAYDTWERRQTQGLRHARVLNDAMADGKHCGCYQWCMFDYATHKDFGSGDRICYHGVMDAFRNPKLAASLYASQQDHEPVLEIGCPMDIGDYNAGHIDSIYAFTNADEVSLYKNDIFVKSFVDTPFKALLHGPIEIDDLIGEMLETVEGYEPKKAKLIHDSLNAAGKYGWNTLPTKYKIKLAKCMLKYHMTFAEGAELYSRYVGGWGGSTVVWKFEAVKDGEVVKTVLRTPDTHLQLETKVSATELCEGEVYDMAEIRIRITDTFGNLASYAQLPIRVVCEGNIENLGPEYITAEGGMTGVYIRTTGTGKASVRLECVQTGNQTIEFTIKGD